jgi:hydroxyacylglutathione hydrolase
MQPVLHVRAFEDNYIWVLRGDSRTHAALVDPGDAAPVLEALPRLGLLPAAILCTHHHNDHVGGIPELLRHYPGLPVYGPMHERIEGLTHPLRDTDEVQLSALGLNFRVLDIPGHTRGHIAYYGHGWLFCGDTLFSAGCGKLFEGTAAQMHNSLTRLSALPDSTEVYCGHEYTVANLRFALTVEPENAAARAYRNEAEALRAAGEPTLPTTLERERQINPFLRASTPTVRAAAEKQAGETLPDSVAVFAAIRRWKDSFRG